ncbi:MAG: hypothetical protein CMP98_03065 [Gammaproteobacteria bacterium]|nr:hypothetical protein [Gammaproteobacteria bacterium]OUU11185.1 MAG: hypothetical protein CBB94_03180 [Gammaproteobacteria bacterium TMED34]
MAKVSGNANSGLPIGIVRKSGESECFRLQYSHEPLLICSDDKDFMQPLSEVTRMQGRVIGNVRPVDFKRCLNILVD